MKYCAAIKKDGLDFIYPNDIPVNTAGTEIIRTVHIVYTTIIKEQTHTNIYLTFI